MADKKIEGELEPTPAPDAGGDSEIELPEGVSEADWADLSDEERRGFTEHQDDPAGEKLGEEPIGDKALAEIAGEGEPKAEEVATPPEAPADATPAKAEDPPPTVVAPVGEGLPDVEVLKFRPVVLDSELKTMKVVPEAVKTALSEAKEKYDAGDMSMDEYMDVRDDLNHQITVATMKAQSDERVSAGWQKSQDYFYNTARPEYMEKDAAGGLTPRAEIMFGALSKAVNRLANDPKFANASDMELLLAADKVVKDTFGIKPAAKAAEPAKGEPPPGRKPDAPLPGIKTLADVPAAAGSDVSGDPFAAVDKLSGEAQEKAIAKMTPAQREAYLDGAR